MTDEPSPIGRRPAADAQLPPASSGRAPRKGERVRVAVEGLDRRGRGFAHIAGKRLALPGSLPGDRVEALVLRRRRDGLEGRVRERLADGPDRVPPLCRHSASCGGCIFQELDYAAQLAWKAETLRAALDAAGLSIELSGPLACDPPWHFRNKMEFSFGARRWVEEHEPPDADRDFALGLHAPGRFDRVLDLEECRIVFEDATPILGTARRLARALGLAPWDPRAHRGLLRHLVLRKGMATGEVLVAVVTSEEAPEALAPYFAGIAQAHPQITTLLQGIQSRPADTAICEREIVHRGPGAIRERLAGLEFRVSAGSFFQTNTRQAERLVALVCEQTLPAREVWDLCSGTGTLALAVARHVERVLGVESVASAVKDARENAALNRIANVEWLHGEVGPASLGSREAPDVVICDPPRAGLHPAALAWLARLPARRLIYVSCNPRRTAEESSALRVGGWRPRSAQAIDLFPHTPHLECVLTFERVGAAP